MLQARSVISAQDRRQSLQIEKELLPNLRRFETRSLPPLSILPSSLYFLCRSSHSLHSAAMTPGSGRLALLEGFVFEPKDVQLCYSPISIGPIQRFNDSRYCNLDFARIF